MGLFRLAPKIQKHVLPLPDMVHRPASTERALRPISHVESKPEQKSMFQTLVGLDS
jgi:hypothetical protein